MLWGHIDALIIMTTCITIIMHRRTTKIQQADVNMQANYRTSTTSSNVTVSDSIDITLQPSQKVGVRVQGLGTRLY